MQLIQQRENYKLKVRELRLSVTKGVGVDLSRDKPVIMWSENSKSEFADLKRFEKLIEEIDKAIIKIDTFFEKLNTCCLAEVKLLDEEQLILNQTLSKDVDKTYRKILMYHRDQLLYYKDLGAEEKPDFNESEQIKIGIILSVPNFKRTLDKIVGNKKIIDNFYDNKDLIDEFINKQTKPYLER